MSRICKESRRRIGEFTSEAVNVDNKQVALLKNRSASTGVLVFIYVEKPVIPKSREPQTK